MHECPLSLSLPLPLQNEEAEELMRKVEKEEEVAASVNPGKQCFHLCIINLVIGTLYCAKVCVWEGYQGAGEGWGRGREDPWGAM